MLIKTNEVSAFRYGHQIIGTRPEQEDCFAALSLGGKGSLLVLADGMGGHSDGEKASACVVNDIVRTFRAAQEPFLLNLAEVAEHANAALGKEKQANRIAADAGCTLIIVRISHGAFDYLSIGDSYLFYQAPGHGLYKRNKLHTVAVELEERGIPKEEIEANPKRKALTCAVMGRQLTRDPHIGSIPLAPGGRILVTSDGLLSLSHGKVDAYLRATVPSPQGDIADIVTTLLDAVVKLNRERQDNTTVVGYQEPPEGTSADTPAVKQPKAVKQPRAATGKSRKLSLTLPAACLLSCIGTLALCTVAWTLYTPQEAQPTSAQGAVSSVIIEQTQLTQLRNQLYAPPKGQQAFTQEEVFYKNACHITEIDTILNPPSSEPPSISAFFRKKTQLEECISKRQNKDQAETKTEKEIRRALTEALHYHMQTVDGPKIKNDIKDANELQKLCNDDNLKDDNLKDDDLKDVAFLRDVFAAEIKANGYLQFNLRERDKENWVSDTESEIHKIQNDPELPNADNLKKIVCDHLKSYFKESAQALLTTEPPDFDGFLGIVQGPYADDSPLKDLFKDENTVLTSLQKLETSLNPPDNNKGAKDINNKRAKEIIIQIKTTATQIKTPATANPVWDSYVVDELANLAFDAVWKRLLHLDAQQKQDLSQSLNEVLSIQEISQQGECQQGKWSEKLRAKLERARTIVTKIEDLKPGASFEEDADKITKMFNFTEVDETLKPFILDKALAFMWTSVEKNETWPEQITPADNDILQKFNTELQEANNALTEAGKLDCNDKSSVAVILKQAEEKATQGSQKRNKELHISEVCWDNRLQDVIAKKAANCISTKETFSDNDLETIFNILAKKSTTSLKIADKLSELSKMVEKLRGIQNDKNMTSGDQLTAIIKLSQETDQNYANKPLLAFILKKALPVKYADHTNESTLCLDPANVSNDANWFSLYTKNTQKNTIEFFTDNWEVLNKAPDSTLKNDLKERLRKRLTEDLKKIDTYSFRAAKTEPNRSNPQDKNTLLDLIKNPDADVFSVIGTSVSQDQPKP